MDLVTGTQVAVGLTVPIPRQRMWELITAVERIGEWSPETTGAGWSDRGATLEPGARFSGRNRFPNGFESTVTCVVTEAVRPAVFAWAVLDGAGQVGSAWRYELHAGSDPDSTEVRHEFTHGPGFTGAREAAAADPRALAERLVTLCRNMTTTIAEMTAAELSMGATR
ncbi:MAG TPA: SRPBCC family protein [Kineosporiaceae bacterium]|nr:SRPBCC family protein [Kineosporiaceae bacterium]